MAFAFVSRVLKGYMVDAVGWWEEEWELIRYGKETSTVKQVDDLNCGTPMDSVSYSVNTENPQLYGCAGSDFRASCDGGRWFGFFVDEKQTVFFKEKNS